MFFLFELHVIHKNASVHNHMHHIQNTLLYYQNKRANNLDKHVEI